MGSRPPEQLSLNGITIRRWRLDDARGLDDAVTSSLDHLRPWMPWIAHEPLSIAERTALLEQWLRSWDDGADFTYAITDREAIIGACGLHRRIATDGLEIGYWVRASRAGNGVATTAASALVSAAFAMDGVSHVEIHHDARNVASGRVPEKVGFTRMPDNADPNGGRVTVVWRLDRVGIGASTR